LATKTTKRNGGPTEKQSSDKGRVGNFQKLL